MSKLATYVECVERGERAKSALKTWREMNLRYPKLIMTSEQALNLLVDLGYPDEAEVLQFKGALGVIHGAGRCSLRFSPTWRKAVVIWMRRSGVARSYAADFRV